MQRIPLANNNAKLYAEQQFRPTVKFRKLLVPVSMFPVRVEPWKTSIAIFQRSPSVEDHWTGRFISR